MSQSKNLFSNGLTDATRPSAVKLKKRISARIPNTLYVVAKFVASAKIVLFQ